MRAHAFPVIPEGYEYSLILGITYKLFIQIIIHGTVQFCTVAVLNICPVCLPDISVVGDGLGVVNDIFQIHLNLLHHQRGIRVHTLPCRFAVTASQKDNTHHQHEYHGKHPAQQHGCDQAGSQGYLLFLFHTLMSHRPRNSRKVRI